MNLRSISPTLLFAVLIVLFGAVQRLGAQVQGSQSSPDFRQLLEKLAVYPADPCGSPYGKDDEGSADVEYSVFERAAEIVTQALSATAGAPRDRAEEAMKKLERMSAEIDAAWPEENRFHFEILDIAPALVVKMTVRTHGRFFVFGVPGKDCGKSGELWKEVGSDGEYHDPPTSLELYPLHRGPSKNARFLASKDSVGCAGMTFGIEYDAYEWDPKNASGIEEIVKQSGSRGIDGGTPEFPEVGVLRTKGSLLTLPYCWFSAIDTWDHPNLCAADTYDLSGDTVRFRSRVYNRPDLLPIAKTIEYAQQHDYPAVLGYCASSRVARKLVRNIPTYIFSFDIRVTHTGKGQERVEMGDAATYRFDIERHGGRWRVVAFRAE